MRVCVAVPDVRTRTVLPASAWVAYFIAIAAVILASIALAIACNAERQLRAIREMKRLVCSVHDCNFTVYSEQIH